MTSIDLIHRKWKKESSEEVEGLRTTLTEDVHSNMMWDNLREAADDRSFSFWRTCKCIARTKV